MPIIRVTRKQIEAANKAREATLKKDDDFRRFEERRQTFEDTAKARQTALQKDVKLLLLPTSRSKPRELPRGDIHPDAAITGLLRPA